MPIGVWRLPEFPHSRGQRCSFILAPERTTAFCFLQQQWEYSAAIHHSPPVPASPWESSETRGAAGSPCSGCAPRSSHGDDSPRSDCYAFICLEGGAGRMLLRKTFFFFLSCWKNLVCWKCRKTWDWHPLLHPLWGHSGNERLFQLRFFCSSRFKAKSF